MNNNRQRTEEIRNKLNQLAWLMDSSIPIPGTQIRFGIDGLIGLIPVLGDIVGAIISSHIISQAARIGAPKSILMKMAFNVGFDALLGVIPIIGDLSDFFWKANQKNINLLNNYVINPQKTTSHSRFFVGMLGVIVVSAVLIIGGLSFLVIRWLWYTVPTIV